MIITKLEYCKKNKQRVNIYIDDCFYMAVYEDLLVTFSLSKGQVITEEKLQEIKSKDLVLLAKKYAFNILTRRNITRKMLREKLIEKGIDAELAENTTEYLRQNKYIDDEQYAKSKAKYLQESKKYGTFRIKEMLLKDGIDRELIDEVLEQLSTDESQINLQQIISKLTKNVDLNDRSQLNKLVNKLSRKGYSFDEIRAGINKIRTSEDFYID